MTIRPFLVLAQARSGSTLLRRALHAHPRIVCHGEVLSPAWIGGLVPVDAPAAEGSARPVVETAMGERTRDLPGFLDRWVYAPSFAPGAQAVGAKVVYMDALGQPGTPALVDYVRRRRVSVIHLHRLNPLAAYISAQRMETFGLSHSDRTGGPTDMDARVDAGTGAGALTVDPDALVKYTAWQSLFRNQIDLSFPGAFPVAYEHLAAQYPELLRFLGVAPQPFVEHLQKLTPPDLREVVRNYDEVAYFDVRPL